ncbi:MAG TPA: ABC transporter ATP-binding protein [Aggregatilinea sp.]|jgi:putative ABC transport system ATP-binding protein|uniref:ABC transporter ATP-binding protein n=1 Tax=Aggregatilinea sp. TaxID=2806333 RepID=UPI002C249AE2|nr:ABC transporter ATP-binding protein [Aggregatilinea sp.]HML22416.1 ABC transporter ATP-binding protein [Aggregatilinea sp.]
MAEPFIQVKNLVKTFDTPAGPLNVLRGIDLTINKGEFVSLVGPSGSGKTTLLNMITGIDSPSDGSVVVDDVNVVAAPEKKLTRWRGRNIGIVFQFFQLLPTLTVLENIIMPMDFCGVYDPKERKDRAMVLLDRFGIANQAYKTPDMLSGGQQQRVAIARALANDPPLIVGDEPTGNLDRMSAQNVFNIFGELASQDRTILVVTHDRELASSGVARLLALTDGMIEATTLEAAARRRTQELTAIRLRTQERQALKTRSQEALAAKQQNQK